MEFYVTMLQMLQFHSTQPTSNVAMRQMTLLAFVREILRRLDSYAGIPDVLTSFRVSSVFTNQQWMGPSVCCEVWEVAISTVVPAVVQNVDAEGRL